MESIISFLSQNFVVSLFIILGLGLMIGKIQIAGVPLGGGVLLRFGLLVLIPLGSWLGGALVERLVDSALG